MQTEIYRNKDGYSDYLKFIADWPFAVELFKHVENKFGESRWAIDTCSQTGPGTYAAHFRPYYGGKGFLCIRIAYNEHSKSNWEFSPN